MMLSNVVDVILMTLAFLYDYPTFETLLPMPTQASREQECVERRVKSGIIWLIIVMKDPYY